MKISLDSVRKSTMRLAALLVIVYITNVIRVHNEAACVLQLHHHQQQQNGGKKPLPGSRGGKAQHPPPQSTTTRRDTQQKQKQPAKATSSGAGKHHKTMTYYSRTRGDRAGSTILDMLMAHAYAHFQHNKTKHDPKSSSSGMTVSRYGGACGNKTFQSMPFQKLLLKNLGVEDELPFACPPDDCQVIDDLEPPQDSSSSSASKYCKIMEWSDYAPKPITNETFTVPWIRSIRSQSSRRKELDQIRELPERKENYQIVVHVRRGDITLCGTKFRRYFANRYYLALIDQHRPKDGRPCNISIFSNHEDPKADHAHEPREPWTDFTSRGYNVFLGTDLEGTWDAMMTADLFIMSKSAFSHVPAMFNNKGKVIYSPYWLSPLPNWEILPKTSTDELATKHFTAAHKKHCANFTTASPPAPKKQQKKN